MMMTTTATNFCANDSSMISAIIYCMSEHYEHIKIYDICPNYFHVYFCASVMFSHCK
jgi:hypothetical protein